MSDIQYWYDEYSKEVNELEEKYTGASKLDEVWKKDEREKIFVECDSHNVRIKELKKSFGLELRLVKDKEQKKEFDGKGKALDEKVKKLTNDILLSRSLANKKDLMSGASTYGGNGNYVPKKEESLEGKTNEDLLTGASKIQDQTMESLSRTKQMIEASKEVGSATIEELRRQRDQMIDIEKEVDQIDTNLIRAGRLITNFSRRMATDKIIQGFSCINILVLLGLILYVAITKKSLTASNSNEDASSATLAPARRFLSGMDYDINGMD